MWVSVIIFYSLASRKFILRFVLRICLCNFSCNGGIEKQNRGRQVAQLSRHWLKCQHPAAKPQSSSPCYWSQHSSFKKISLLSHSTEPFLQCGVPVEWLWCSIMPLSGRFQSYTFPGPLALLPCSWQAPLCLCRQLLHYHSDHFKPKICWHWPLHGVFKALLIKAWTVCLHQPSCDFSNAPQASMVWHKWAKPVPGSSLFCRLRSISSKSCWLHV